MANLNNINLVITLIANPEERLTQALVDDMARKLGAQSRFDALQREPRDARVPAQKLAIVDEATEQVIKRAAQPSGDLDIRPHFDESGLPDQMRPIIDALRAVVAVFDEIIDRIGDRIEQGCHGLAPNSEPDRKNQQPLVNVRKQPYP